VDECEPLAAGGVGGGGCKGRGGGGRGLHSSTFQLIVSAVCVIGGALRGCLGAVQGVSGGIRGCAGCVLVSETVHVELKSERV